MVDKVRVLNKRAASAAAKKRNSRSVNQQSVGLVDDPLLDGEVENVSVRKSSKRRMESQLQVVEVVGPVNVDDAGFDTCDEIDEDVEEVDVTAGTQGGDIGGKDPVVDGSEQLAKLASLEERIKELQNENNLLKIKVNSRGSVGVVDMTSKKRKNGTLEDLFEKRHQAMLIELKSYVTSKIFPDVKFPVNALMAKAMCRNAVARSDVMIPKEATAAQFGEAYYKVIGARLKHARVNCQTGARNKYIADLKQGGVIPPNFADKLEEHYRDYYDEKGVLIEGREENLNAFFYFVDRILSSVNAEFTKFGPDKKKRRRTAMLSDVFTESDEAFGLLLVENYESRWRAQAADGHTKGEWRKEKKYQAKYTSSNHGLKNVTWDDAGINSYNEKVEMIRELRKKESKNIMEQRIQDKFRNVGDRLGQDDGSDSEDENNKKNESKRPKLVEAIIDPTLIAMMAQV